MAGFHLFDENEELDSVLGNNYDELQIGQYNQNFAVNEQYSKELEKVTEKYQLPASVALPFVLAGGTADSETAKQLANDIAYNKTKKEAEIWQELQQRYQYEDLEKNMKMSLGDVLTGGLFPGGAKPGDVQYGVWFFAGLDALFQTYGPSGKWSVIASATNALLPGQPMAVGRSQAYLRDIRQYDKMLRDGYTPAEAQEKLQVDVSFTEVENIGKDTNLRGDIRKHIDMMREANRLGGEPVLWNMMRQVLNGKPVNFDRSTLIGLESVKAEDTPYYETLITDYGMSPEEASKFIYNKIGEPLKNFDENGEIHYTSAYRPNQINFYAGRNRQKYMFMGQQLEQDLFAPEWADKNILLEYSPGKVHTAEVYEPGTRQFDLMSGLIDASYQIVPEILAGKGLKGVSNLKKGFRRTNDAFELSQDLAKNKKTGEIINISPRKLADRIADDIANEADPFTGKGDFSKYINPKTGKAKVTDDLIPTKRDLKKGIKKIKKEHTAFGLVPRFFQTTKKEILEQPIMVDYFKAIAATDDIATISTNPVLGKLHPAALKAMADESDWKQIQKIHSDMMSTGYEIVDDAGIVKNVKLAEYYKDGTLPVKGSFVLNKMLQETARKGTELQQSKGVFGKAIGSAFSAIGDEQAAYRSAGSYLGEKARIGRTMLEAVIPGSPYRRFRKLIDPDQAETGVLDDLDSAAELIQAQKIADKDGLGKLQFEKYLGFSSNFNSTYNPYYRKLLGVIPDMGIPLNSLENGYRQLVSHLQINGYGTNDMNRILNKFMDIDFSDKQAVRNFTKEQVEEDLFLVAKRGGEWKYVAQAAEKMFAGQDKSKIYALMKDKKILPNVGGGYEMYRIKTPDGAYVDMPMMTGSMFSEMADNIAPLMNYKILHRAMGRMWKSYDESEEIGNVFTKNLNDAWEFGKYNVNKLFGDSNVSKVNPYDTGVISVKRLEDDFMTNMFSFYTRNVFKPLVLARAAFFTRVFLEEQARIAVSGLSGLYNHPFKYLQWLASHDPNAKWIKLVPGIKGAKYNDDGVELMASLEAMEATKNSFKVTDFFGPPSLKKKNTEYLAKTKDELTTKKYSKHLFYELIMLRNDPIARKVAEYGYGNKELTKWLASPEGRAARMDLFNYGGNKWQEILKDGDFLDQHIQYLESRIRIKTGGNIVEGKDLVKGKNGKYRYNLQTSDLGDTQLRKAIGEGKFTTSDGKVLDFYENAEKTISSFKLKPVLNELELLVENGLDAGAVKVAKRLFDEDDKSFLAQLDDMLNVAQQAIFDNLMTKPIGYLNRSPVFKQYRWVYLSNKFKDFSPSLQKQFIKEAQAAAVPQSLIRELKGLSGIHRNGKISDYDAMNVESKAYGLAMVKNLLYDTKQKHALSDKLLNIFPFAEVWFEVFQTWGQLLAANPTSIRKGYVGLRGATSADSFGTSSEDGFITPDPRDKDKDMFVQPFGGHLSNIIFGEDSSTRISPRGYVQGINLLGQGFVPGPNPLVAFAMNKVLPEYGQPYEWLREQLFGDFAPPEKASEAFAYSPVYNKLRAAALDPEKFENITENSSEIEKMRANATTDIFRFGMASGDNMKLYDSGKLNPYLNKLFPNQWTPDTVSQKQIDEAFLEYSKNKSGSLFFYQFLYQFFGPTGFKAEYFLKDDDGHLWGQAVLYEEFVRIREKNEGNDLAAYNEFLTLYGYEHPYLFSPKSQSETGRKPSSKRVQEFQAENKEVFDQLKLSGYYLNVDNPNEEKNYVDIVKEKSLMSPDQYRRSVNDTIGFFRYKTFSSNLEKLDIPYKTKTIIKRTYREALKSELPGFQADEYGLMTPPATQDIFNEMRDKWAKIPFVMEQEAGKGFAEIMPFWEEMEAISMDESPTGTKDWWLKSDDPTALSMRIWMYNKAQQIIAEYPEFWSVWNGVMLKLYRDDFEVLDYVK